MTNSSDPLSPEGTISQRITEILNLKNRFAYLAVNPELKITSRSENAALLLNRKGVDPETDNLYDLIWEFVGSEDEISSVLFGDMPEYKIDSVHWIQNDGNAHYFDLVVLPLSPTQSMSGLLVLIEERDEIYSLQQTLVQERNELRMAKVSLGKANQRLEHVNQLKSVFISMIVHDLRRPLSGIVGYAQLLDMHFAEDKSSDGSRYTKGIQNQTSHMERLISDMLDLDQIDKGLLKFHPIFFNLNKTIQNGLSLVSHAISEKNLVLETDLSEDEVTALADPNRALQIFINLIGNAIKFTDKGGKIIIRTFTDDKWAVMKIADTGIGIDANELDNLFHLYYRVKDAVRSERTGTGIGLYIVKSLIDLHDGKIEVESVPGDGSIFTIYLPNHVPPGKLTEE